MKTTRKRCSADFKAEVALEAIRVDLALAELAAKHAIHHTMIAAQCRLLSISRSSYYAPVPAPETEETLALMRVIDAAPRHAVVWQPPDGAPSAPQRS